MDVRNPLFRNCTSVNSINGGIQRIYHFDNGYGASVVCHSASYGGKDGLYELAVITWETPIVEHNYSIFRIVHVPEIIKSDSVVGWLTEDMVEVFLEKIKAL